MYYNFPASGLRSSVVSVRISFILDSFILDGWVTYWSHDIKLSFSRDEPITVASY